MQGLTALNASHDICGMDHTHSGLNMVGGPIWDLWLLFQGLDSRYIGMNYDIGHATIEGGFGGWQTSARLAASQMRGIALKDFFWPARKASEASQQNSTKLHQPEPVWCPIGDGVVDFVQFFSIIRENGFSGPVQMHFEYPEFHGVENGATTLGIPKEQFIAMVQQDVQRTRAYIQQAGFASA